MSPITQTLPEQLRILRQQQGLSMRQLAEKVGISEAYVSLIEANKRTPSQTLLKKLMQVLVPDPHERQRCLQELDPSSTADSKPVPETVAPIFHMDSTFDAFLLEIHMRLFWEQRLEIQQAITEALPKYGQPLQLQILIAFLEAARGQWLLADRALDMAQQSFAFNPAGLNPQTLQTAELLLLSLKAMPLSAPDSPLPSLKKRLIQFNQHPLHAFLTAFWQWQEMQQLPHQHTQILAQSCEKMALSLPQMFPDLFQWLHQIWISALRKENTLNSLQKSLYLTQSALAFASHRAELWFQLADIYEALYRLNAAKDNHRSALQALAQGLLFEPDAPLSQLTQAWSQSLNSQTELQRKLLETF